MKNNLHPKPITRELPWNSRALRTPLIWAPAAPREGFTVALFRKTFTLPRGIKTVFLHISASERFDLFLDGRLIARGPSRSDQGRWGCMRVALPRLNRGPHLLAARVWHFGDFAGIGQLGGPAFLLVSAGHNSYASCFDTGPSWRCTPDNSRTPITRHAWKPRSPYYVVGCGEQIRGDRAAWNWEQPSFDDTAWSPAVQVADRAACPWGNLRADMRLVPDPLPQMENRPAAFARVLATGNTPPPALEPLRHGRPLTLPPNTSTRFILDRGELTNAYVTWIVSRGTGASIRTVSAEAPYEPGSLTKTNRDEPDGKTLNGHLDEFLPDGGICRAFSPLWFRSFRYLEVTIRTRAEPLTIEQIACLDTGFPLRRRARFRSTGPGRDTDRRVRDVSWRTIRLCAHETFFDCPHFEQAQFPGDTRVQAVYHYLVANDDRLARKAIGDFHASRLPDGMLQCRFPSRRLQILPTFALQWIGMLDDFRVYRGNPDFLRPYLHAARDIMEWFTLRLRPDGLLGLVPFAPFVDWTPPFAMGNAPQTATGGSAILTCLLAEACGWMAGLEPFAGYPELANHWLAIQRRLRTSVRARCWSSARGLLADTDQHSSFSVHAQTQAILAGVLSPAAGRSALRRALKAGDVTQAGSHYYRYYLHEALHLCGLRREQAAILARWPRGLQGTGLTTWPETDNTPRSDCHAWSVLPEIALYQSCLGIRPSRTGAGFNTAEFSPDLADRESAQGQIQTPHGTITVNLSRTRHGKLQASIRSPVPIT